MAIETATARRRSRTATKMKEGNPPESYRRPTDKAAQGIFSRSDP